MAIYQYECETCGNCFEEIMSIKADSKTYKCPKCKEMANKVMSQTSFKLEGDSWAKDGYAGKG